VNRQLAERATVAALDRNFERLELELRLGTPRRHLDVLVEFLETLTRSLPPTKMRDAYQERLDRINRIVARRHHLRLVKGTNP
jgi:hypothetical protein